MSADAVSLRPGGAGASFRPGGGVSLLSSFSGGSRPKPSAGAKEESSYGDFTKYDREFLLSFQERCTTVPPELESTASDVLLGSGENEFVTPEERFASVGADGKAAKPLPDDRDWRSRNEPGTPRGEGSNGGGGGGGNKRANARAGSNKDGVQDRTLLPPDDNERLLRNVKSVLNKITPEKFDRLMEQLLEEGIQTASALKETISLIFDKAIWEPTFCPLYAAMCVSLSKALPEFPPLEGEDKPLTFRRVLLNTCQEEFEGAALARSALETITDVYEREAAERKVKLRTMGNIRLIGELYKSKMIGERILQSCISELLGKQTKTDPPEENVEALINLLITVGKELDAASSRSGVMELYFQRLQQLAASKKLAARLRFMCRDVIDLRKNNWVPRREKLQAKKLDEVRADAAAALGIVKPQDDNLFPEGPNGPSDDGWSVAGKKNKPKAEEAAGYSALTGQYVPSTSTALPTDRPRRDAKPAAAKAVEAEEAAAPEAGAAKAKGKPVAKLSAEEAEEQILKLFAEFKNASDLKDALLCVKDIQERAPAGLDVGSLVCALALQVVIDVSAERYAEQLTKLLAHLVSSEAFTEDTLAASLGKVLETLDDVAIDVPMAPKLMGVILGGLLAARVLQPARLQPACEAVADMFCRRDLAVAVLTALAAAGTDMTAFVASVSLPAFLVDEEEDLASLKALFEKRGVAAAVTAAL